MIEFVTGAAGAGITTTAHALAGDRVVALDPRGWADEKETDDASAVRAVVARLLGLGHAAVGDIARGLSDVAALVYVRDRESAVVDAGAWARLGGAFADLEAWLTHLGDLSPVPLTETADPILGFEVIEDPGPVYDALLALRETLADALERLRCDARLVLVVTPDSRGVNLARDTLAGAALLGLPVAAMVVNRVTPTRRSRSSGT